MGVFILGSLGLEDAGANAINEDSGKLRIKEIFLPVLQPIPMNKEIRDAGFVIRIEFYST
ncbi:MAG: hypothetical protein ACOYMP_14350 [Nodosilinea sp.]